MHERQAPFLSKPSLLFCRHVVSKWIRLLIRWTYLIISINNSSWIRTNETKRAASSKSFRDWASDLHLTNLIDDKIKRVKNYNWDYLSLFDKQINLKNPAGSKISHVMWVERNSHIHQTSNSSKKLISIHFFLFLIKARKADLHLLWRALWKATEGMFEKRFGSLEQFR